MSVSDKNIMQKSNLPSTNKYSREISGVEFSLLSGFINDNS